MEPLFTPEQLVELRAYRAPQYLWAALSPLVHLAVSVAVLRFGIRPLWALSVRVTGAGHQVHARARGLPVLRVFDRVVERLWGGAGWGTALCFAALYFLLNAAIWAPVDFWFGWVHERDFGFTSEPASAWWWRALKSQAISGLGMAMLAFGLFALARRTRHWWLLLGVGAGVALTGAAIMDPYRGQLYFEQTPLPQGPLRSRLTRVLHEADVEFRELWVQKTSAASVRIQAWFAGQGATRSILMNDVLLERFSEEEIVAVIAHEAAHVHEPKWPGRIASALALLLLLFGADRLLRHSAHRGWFGATAFGDLRNLPLLMFAFWLLATAVRPASLALSRARELEADRFALALTGEPEIFRGMLVKAARINRMDPEPPSWLVFLGFSHPPIVERLAALPEPRPQRPAGVLSPPSTRP